MKRVIFLCWLVLQLVAAAPALAIDPADTRLLGQPAVSRSHVAFVYAGDLWAAGLDGKNVRRLTAVQGVSNPAFSPDGALVAFTAQYEGNADVYVIPVAGGVPTRLTWHPGRDVVQSFTPDGSAVLFTSARAVFTGRYTQLFTVPVTGGVEAPLPIPNAFRATYSPDGKRLAYNPLSDAFTQWKHYRGGTNSTLWLYESGTHATERIPQPPDRAQRRLPDVAGGHRLLRLGPRGRVQPVLVRHEVEGHQAAHPVRGLPDPQRLGRRRPHRLRAGRLPASVRSGKRQGVAG